MKALAWGLGVFIFFCAFGWFWNREFLLGPDDRFGFYLWVGVGGFAGLLSAAVMASDG